MMRSAVPITVKSGVRETASAFSPEGLPATGMAAAKKSGWFESMFHVPVPPIEPPKM